MTLIDQIFQLLLSGITMGSIYALVAIGFNIIYNTTNILNFAQDEFVMLGGMCTAMFHPGFHINIFLSLRWYLAARVYIITKYKPILYIVY